MRIERGGQPLTTFFRVRSSVSEVLGDQGESAIPALADATSDERVAIRRGAMLAFGSARASALPALDVMIEALGDAPEVREVALLNLTRLNELSSRSQDCWRLSITKRQAFEAVQPSRCPSWVGFPSELCPSRVRVCQTSRSRSVKRRSKL